jgi:uncharacterized membrane protein YqgA involved in biofilm formation
VTGTIVNVCTILVGSLAGLLIGRRLPERFTEITMQGLGVVTFYLGISMARSADTGPRVLVVLVCLIVGSWLGELLDLERRLNEAGAWLERRFAPATADGNGAGLAAQRIRDGDGAGVAQEIRDGAGGRRREWNFTRAFAATSILYCVGPMAILGSIRDGLVHDPSILITKSVMDGIASVAFAAALGPGTAFSALPILIYQGSMTLLAGLAGQVLTPAVIAGLNALGGLVIICLALSMWQLGKFRIASMLPALAVIVAVLFVLGRYGMPIF